MKRRRQPAMPAAASIETEFFIVWIIEEVAVRKQTRENGLVFQAVAGTYVVTMGWDIEDGALKDGLLGFAIQRVDHTENETIFLRGMKSFPGTSPQLPLGGTASSHEQPFQSFQWADYAAKPNHSYTYTLIPMYGHIQCLFRGGALSCWDQLWHEALNFRSRRGALTSDWNDEESRGQRAKCADHALQILIPQTSKEDTGSVFSYAFLPGFD